MNDIGGNLRAHDFYFPFVFRSVVRARAAYRIDGVVGVRCHRLRRRRRRSRRTVCVCQIGGRHAHATCACSSERRARKQIVDNLNEVFTLGSSRVSN